MERKKAKKKKEIAGNKWLWTIIGGSLAVVALVIGLIGYNYLGARYTGEDAWVYIPRSSSTAAMEDSLSAAIGPRLAARVMNVWEGRGGSLPKSSGAYVIPGGASVFDISRKLLYGQQTPVKVTFHNVRTLPQLAERISAHLDFSASDFMAACDTVLSAQGYSLEQYPAAFFPDTYEFYWNASAATVVERLADYRDKFWTEERRAKASALGLTPEDVAVVASIVEEETAKADERPAVARLYLNRLQKGMKLQADPTVKYACGDFSLRRILQKHLEADSPYNTYKYPGLPPGPIRIVEKSTIDDVLDSPSHPYLYMCAKEDFSGYHNFAVSYTDHQANARRYQAELNRRGIH